jgi:4-nitrophenyl phosphatase
MTNLHAMRAAIIDMDGVLWAGETPLPGLLEFFHTLRTRAIPFVLATNNSSSTADQYVAKLARLGVRVAPDEVLTSGLATALYLRGQANGSGGRVFAIGESGVRQCLTEQGFTLLDLFDVRADYVVCGMDRALSWDKLATATLNVRAGARLVGTNPDTSFPTERGIVHGNGAILAALQAATGTAPVIVGKPEPIMYQQAMLRLGAAPAHTVAIGDRLETDILGAVRAGIRSLLVLTGIAARADLAGLDYSPTWVMNGLPDVVAALTGRKAISD